MIPVIMAAITYTATHAQLFLGVRGGLNWAQMEGKEGILGDPGTLLGPTAALIIGLPITGHFTLVPELGYVQRGYHRGQVPMGLFPEERLVLDYADLALLGKFHPVDGPTRPYVLVGATVGRLLGARLFQTNPFTQEEQGVVLDINRVRTSHWSEGPMNPWNLGLCAGFGFAFTTGSSQVVVEGRYLYGLSNIWNEVPVTDVNGVLIGKLNGYDRSIALNVGWLVPVGRSGPKDGAAPAR